MFYVILRSAKSDISEFLQNSEFPSHNYDLEIEVNTIFFINVFNLTLPLITLSPIEVGNLFF